MKKVILIILTLGFSSLAMASDIDIKCDDHGFGGGFIGTPNGEDIYTSLILRYHFAAAKLICENSMSFSIKEKRAFRCAGVWTFDSHRPDNTDGTIAVLNFKPSKDSKWSAEFVASHGYNRDKVKLICTINAK